MKVLLTGASGRLGPFVVKDLEEAGHEVELFSRRDLSGEFPDNRIIQGDITNPHDCLRAFESGYDAVQHCAAQPSPSDHPYQMKASEKKNLPFNATMKTNILGTYHLLQAAVRHDVKVFVMTGSNCSLGHGYRISSKPFPFKYFPIDESHSSDTEDSYSFSKLVDEQLLEMYARTYGIRTYTVRSAGICNAQRRQQMKLSAGPAKSWNPWLWGWVGSEDVAFAQRLLMEKAENIEQNGTYYCNGDDTTAIEPTEELMERFKKEFSGASGHIDGFGSLFTNKKLKNTVGWEHRTFWRDS